MNKTLRLVGGEGTQDRPSQRRIVRVFITDPDTDVPIDKCLLYQGEETLTEATDGELFLALGIPELLADHNERRVDLGLKPIKARDLRMVVATLIYI